jgi:uncharacterized protein (TIGR02145 family)
VPENFNNIHGTIISVDGTPVSDAQVNVVTQTLGTGITYTNSEGVFSGRVPKNQQLTLNVYLTCSTTNDLTLVHTETINSETQDLSVAITTGLEGSYPLTGTVATCQGQPVEEGYVKVGNQVHFTTDGAFAIQTCFIGNYSIRGFDISNTDSVKVSDLISVWVETTGGEAGIISTCSSMFDTLSDNEGHIYPIVLIGDQWWMAKNLSSAMYANGDTIPHVTSSSFWDPLTTPAWCNYDNQVENDSIYGKLYTWYAVSDPRNICPTGWHVPTEVEWSILSGYLGNNANWKMKSTTGWQNIEPNVTNESGFSALPGGQRPSNFVNIGVEGNWWTNTENGANYANYRVIYSSLINTNGFLTSGAATKRIGFSVRCVKD